MKYEIGDFVSKPVTGICKIEDILYLNPQDERNNILYYLMKPIEDKKEKIYVPVSNSDSRLRSCMTKEKAWNLIKRIPEIPTAWTNNEKMREQNYKAAIKANDPEALVAIIKMIYERKQKRLAQGKKCTTTDARYFQMAENLLYMELGVALGKPKEEICKRLLIILTSVNRKIKGVRGVNLLMDSCPLTYDCEIVFSNLGGHAIAVNASNDFAVQNAYQPWHL